MNSQTERPKVYEDRPGWANCWPPKPGKSRAAFVGVTVLDGKKHWVNVYVKEDRNGTRYVSVNVEPWKEQPSKKDEPQDSPSREASRGPAR